MTATIKAQFRFDGGAHDNKTAVGWTLAIFDQLKAEWTEWKAERRLITNADSMEAELSALEAAFAALSSVCYQIQLHRCGEQ